MGLEALRSFVQQLDATTYDGPRSSSGPPTTPTATRTTSSKDSTATSRTTLNHYGSAAPDPRRTLSARRLEAAEMLARPFAVRLEADGLSNAKVLARVPMREWGLPECLVEEVERMLGLLAARTCAYSDNLNNRNKKSSNCVGSSSTVSTVAGGGGGVAHVTRKHPGTGGRGTVSSRSRLPGGQYRRPLTFDPKFQRSAIDPFGRPPRLENLLSFTGPQRRRSPVTADKVEVYDGVDLPPGIWDPAPTPTEEGKEEVPESSRPGIAKEACPIHNGADNVIEGECFGCLLAILSPLASTDMERHEDSDELSGQPSVSARPLQQHHPGGSGSSHHGPRHHDEWTACTNKNKGGNSAGGNKNATFVGAVENPTPKTAKTATTTAPYSYICQVPTCGAAFRRAPTLRTHQRSHTIMPEYLRLRRAPQLFRDPPPAPSEGHGANAARFRLRTELPASVRKELLQLQEEASSRRRQSLLALPQLPGAAATWAGVATLGRSFGQTT